MIQNMKRKTVRRCKQCRKKSKRRTMKSRNGGMKNTVKCCASKAARLCSEGAVEVLKSTAQDEIRSRGPLKKIENQNNMIRNRLPKSYENFNFINENGPYYNTKPPHSSQFQHF